MKNLLLITLCLFQLSAFSQYSSTFQNAYNQYPDIPKGLLESVSWANTRMYHLTGLEEESCSQMPRALGVMGLFVDGKNYFRENAKLVANLSGISVQQQLNNPENQILAYANAFNTIYNGYKTQTNSEELSIYFTLNYLSEIPDSGRVNQFALDAQIYQIMRFMKDQEFASTNNFSIKNYDLKHVFGIENFRILSAQKVMLGENSVTNELGDNYSLSAAKSTEYGPAVWNPAPSCNYSSRSGTAISAIVIHTIQGSYAGAISWSQNCSSNVSFHYVLRSSDGQVTQMVMEANKAWHVGSANPYTIGYEHEGWVNQTGWYTEAMYQSSAALSRDIVNSGYGIPALRTFFGAATTGTNTLGNCTKIKGHQHYANQTHTDPGINWNWEKYYKLINNSPSITPVTAASGTLHDSGGAAGNYGNDERLLWLVQPAGATSVSLQFSQFNIEANWDFMLIYDGATTNAPLIGKYTGTTSPGTITSSAGSILIEFRSDCATTAPGWTINYTSSNSGGGNGGTIVLPQANINPGASWKTSDFDILINDVSTQSSVEESYYLALDRVNNTSDWQAQPSKGFVFEEFNNIANWTQQTGTFTINSNRIVNADESLSNTNLYLNVAQSNSVSYLYTWKQKFTGSGTNQRAGLHFMSSNSTLDNRGESYFVFLREGNDKVQIYSVTGNVFTLRTDDNFTIDNNIDYDVKVTYSAATGWIRVYVDGALASSWQDPNPIQSGNSISLRSANSIVEFDDVRMYQSRGSLVNITTGSTGLMRYESIGAQPTGRIIANVKNATTWSVDSDINLLIDKSAPVQSFINDGTGSDLTHFQGLTISGNWDFNDPHSGILEYEYAVGTSSNSDDIIAWTSTTSTNFTEAFTSGVIGQTYYVSIKAINGAGLISQASSNGQTYSSLSLDENKMEQISIFPNPFSTQLNINNLPGKSFVALYDINGKIVFENELEKTNNSINIDHINAGVYQLLIKHNDNSIIKRVIKN